MSIDVKQLIARRRRMRFAYAIGSLVLYFSYALQWIFDVDVAMAEGSLPSMFPIVVFCVLIILMCALEFVHFYREDHHHDPEEDELVEAAPDDSSAPSASEAADEGGHGA